MPIGTPTFIGNTANTATGSTVVLTTAGGVTAGDSIIVLIYVASLTVTVSSVTDSAGNTYAVDISRLHTTAARRVAIASCHNALALASGQTITATMSASTPGAKVIDAMTVSGLATSSTLDATSGNDGTSTTWSTGSTGTLAQADELAVAGAISEGTTANTPDGGWNELDDRTVALNRRMVMQQQVVSATTALNGGGTWGNAVWVGVIATYKAAAGPVTVAADTAAATAAGDPVAVVFDATVAAGTAEATAAGDPVVASSDIAIDAGTAAATASGDPVAVVIDAAAAAGSAEATAGGDDVVVIADSPTTVDAGTGSATASGDPVAVIGGTTIPVGSGGGAIAAGGPSLAAFEVRVTPLLIGVDGVPEHEFGGVIPVALEDTTLLTQFADLEVSPLQLNEPRAGRVTLSIHDQTPIAGSDTPGSLLASLEPFQQALWIGYKRPLDETAEGLVYGQCNVITDYAAGTVTLEVGDPLGQRCAHAYIRRGDDVLNIDKNRGRVRATGGVWLDDDSNNVYSVDLIVEAARNIPAQQTRGVPALGLAFFTYGAFDGSDEAPWIEFERGQEVTDLIAHLSRAVTGPNIDVTPAWTWPAHYYAEVDCWDPFDNPDALPVTALGRNLDPVDPDDPQDGEVIFELGMGVDNLIGLTETPGLPATHVHVLDAAKAFRETAADADSSALVGVWTMWVEADLTIKRASQEGPTHVPVAADTVPLRALAEAKVRALGVPPKFFTVSLRPDDAQVYHFGHRYWTEGATTGDFYLGDYVRVRAQRGHRSFSTLARIIAAKFTQPGSNGLPVLELTMIPAIGGAATPDLDE